MEKFGDVGSTNSRCANNAKVVFNYQDALGCAIPKSKLSWTFTNIGVPDHSETDEFTVVCGPNSMAKELSNGLAGKLSSLFTDKPHHTLTKGQSGNCGKGESFIAFCGNTLGEWAEFIDYKLGKYTPEWIKNSENHLCGIQLGTISIDEADLAGNTANEENV